MKATYNETILATSETYEVVENNVYFPAASVKWEHLTESEKQYTCPWKGKATYYHLQVGDRTQNNAAWSYQDPKPAAQNIAGHVCFDRAAVTTG